MPAPQITTSADGTLIANDSTRFEQARKRAGARWTVSSLRQDRDGSKLPERDVSSRYLRPSRTGTCVADKRAHDDTTGRPPPPSTLGRLLARRGGGRPAPFPPPDGGHLGARREGATARASGHWHPRPAALPPAGRHAVQRAGARLAYGLRRSRVPLHGGHPGSSASRRPAPRQLSASSILFPEPVPDAVPPAPDLLRHPAVLLAGRRLRPGQEHLADHDRAEGTRAPPVGGVDLRVRDAGRLAEPATRVDVEGLPHEVRPDRQRTLRARESGRGAVVEADPHQGQEVRRVAHEPRVATVVGGA